MENPSKFFDESTDNSDINSGNCSCRLYLLPNFDIINISLI